MDNKKVKFFSSLFITVIISCSLPAMPVIAEEIKETVAEEDSYVIKKGDTLWDISEEYLDNPFLWPDIWKENRYIKNPDLIYPGNMLNIPGILLPLETEETDETDREWPAVEETETEVVQPDSAYVTGESVDTRPAPVEHIEYDMDSPGQQESQAAESDIIDASGYITDDIDSWGYIVGSPEDKNIFASGDDVTIRLNEKTASAGEKFTIFRKPESVSHPKTGKYVGKLFVPVGVLELTRVQGKDASGRIVQSYTYSSSGDQIQPYYASSAIADRVETPPQIEGYVIASHEGRTLNVEHGIVYLDRGTTDGVVPGTVFYVMGEDQVEVIGELNVISVQSLTSTALVTKGFEPFGRGSRVMTRTND